MERDEGVRNCGTRTVLRRSTNAAECGLSWTINHTDASEDEPERGFQHHLVGMVSNGSDRGGHSGTKRHRTQAPVQRAAAPLHENAGGITMA